MSITPTGDFLVEAIFDRLPAGARRSNTGFTNFDCPMCCDKRRRCGVKQRLDGVGIHCFNCDFKAGWSQGSWLSQRLRDFLAALGLPENQIAMLAFRAAQMRKAMLANPHLREQVPHYATPTFDTITLPTGARSMIALSQEGCQDPDFFDAQTYIHGRGKNVADFQHHHWSPSTINGMNRRVIIPMMYEGRLVGYSARAIDADTNPRYHSSTQPNFLFNARALTDPKRKIVILVEGVLDAIAIDSVGLLGARLNQTQIAWIKSHRKRVILLPDRDERGLAMIDVALQQGWQVACPWGEWWDHRVKDAAQATQLYGRLWTLTSVLEAATDSAAKLAAIRLRLQP